MTFTIKSKYLQVEILAKGAEICSIKSLKTNKEYMWNANPEIWGSHAPVLFPAIGAFKNNQCTINGESYKVPRHGFIRHNENLVVKSQTENQLNLQLNYSEDTLQIYPYKFQFNIIFQLKGNTLHVIHQIKNLDNKEIYFSLGGHPAFKCPINDGELYEDYYLEFEKTENATTTLLGTSGLISDNTKPILENTKTLPLSNSLFDNDALIFKELNSRKVSLKSSKSKQVLTVSYPDFYYLGIWAKPKAPFVCIEPWLGLADHENTDGDFLKKDGIVTLNSHTVFDAQYSIEITE